MAQQLIEQWGLAVLRVQLDISTPVPAVTSDLISYVAQSPRTLWSSRHPLSSFGLSGAAGPPGAMRVPDDLRDDIADSLGSDLMGESSLWIRLVPPYGYLGAIPWEESLLAVTDVPLFRVPDRLPVASDPGRRWSVAIAVDTHPDSDWAPGYVQQFVESLGAAVGSELVVDVFTDARTVQQLRTWTGPEWARVHDPGAAKEASRTRIRRLTSQRREPGAPVPIDLTSPGRIWADWIAAGLQGHAVRALHVVLEPAWDEDTPLLAVAPDPSNPARTRDCSFVIGDDVRRLADAVGAATLSLGTPPDAAAGTAMRVIADRIGQQRPGATIHSEIAHDLQGRALARMHGFLSGNGRQLPRDRSLFAYVQPEQVRSALVDDWPQPSPASAQAQPSWDDPLPASSLPSSYQLPDPDDVSAVYAQGDTVPNWVAASERYVGQQLSDLARPSGTPEPQGYKGAYERGAVEALAELQAIVVKHAKQS